MSLLAIAGPLAAQAAAGFDVRARDGTSLHVEVLGSGADTMVVPFATLLAGPLARLAPGRTLVFYDMRGRGRSGRPEQADAYGLDAEIEDLESVRAALGIDRMDLVGFSYLGAITALYAARHPRHVRRLVLLGPLPPRADLMPADPAVVQDRLDTTLLSRLEDMPHTGPEATGYCRTWWEAYLPVYLGRPERAQALVGDLHLGCSLPNEHPDHVLDVVGRIFASAGAWDWSEAARGITSPTLVIHGDGDIVAPLRGAEAWANEIADAELQVVSGAGHLAWAEEPTLVLERVESFLARRSGR